jgi:hypothetical protein
VKRWGDRQLQIAAALRVGEPGALPGAPQGVIDMDGLSCPRRFNVYRNNVVAGLCEALEASYPAVRRLIGEECFRETARRYAVEHAPASPVMALYGADFPDFIADFAPLAGLPYLADVARIERAWLEAYHAAEADTLEPAVLAAVAPARYADLRFIAHPSLRLVCSRHPALTVWRMNVADATPVPVDLWVAEDALVVRPEAEVQVRAVPPGGGVFLRVLLRGQSLAAAAAAAAEATGAGEGRGAEPFDLAMHLRGLLESGAFSGVRPASHERRRRGQSAALQRRRRQTHGGKDGHRI